MQSVTARLRQNVELTRLLAASGPLLAASGPAIETLEVPGIFNQTQANSVYCVLVVSSVGTPNTKLQFRQSYIMYPGFAPRAHNLLQVMLIGITIMNKVVIVYHSSVSETGCLIK